MSANSSYTTIDLFQLLKTVQALQIEIKEANPLDLSFVRKCDEFLTAAIMFCKDASRISVSYNHSRSQVINYSLEQHLLSSIQDQSEFIQAVLRQAILDTTLDGEQRAKLRRRLSTLFLCLNNSIDELYHEYRDQNTLPLFVFFQKASPNSE